MAKPGCKMLRTNSTTCRPSGRGSGAVNSKRMTASAPATTPNNIHCKAMFESSSSEQNPNVFPAKSTKSQFSYLQHSHIWITYLQDCREKAKPSKTSRSTTKVDSIKNLQRTRNQSYTKVFFSC